MKKLIVMLAMIPATAMAEFYSGNTLLDKLQSKDILDRIQALGYIQGVSDTVQNVTSCVPSNVTAGQINDMVKNYLENVPLHRNKTADTIIGHVLKTAFPCANKQNNGRGA